MSGEVRLWRHNYDTDFRARHLMLSDDDAQRAGITPYIALPAAKHAALMRVVKAARALLDLLAYEHPDFGYSEIADLRAALAAPEPAPPQAGGDDDPACTCAALPQYPCIKHAPEPAQAVGETDVEWLLRQMETQDLATLRGIAKSFPCERNGGSCDKPAQAGEAVAWAVQSVYGDDIEAVRLTEARAEQYRREIGERDWRVIPLYAAPSRPGGAA